MTAPHITQAAPPVKLQKHVQALDGWRAVACIMVLYHHTGFFLHFGPLYVWGSTGVHLFFALSGYLLFRPFCKAMLKDAPFEFKNFYARRILRIYPAYLLALVVYLSVRYATGSRLPSNHNLLMHLLMLFNSSDPHEFFAINGAFWTLAIEAQFYALLPLLAFMVYRLVQRRPEIAMFGTAALFACIGLISRGVELYHTTGPGMIDPLVVRYHSVFSFLDFFSYGMVVTAFESTVMRSRKLERWPVTGLLLAGLMLFLAANGWCAQATGGDLLQANSFWCLWLAPLVLCSGIAAILMVVVRSDGLLTSFLVTRPMVYVGRISYSVYLFHFLVESFIFRRFPLHDVSNYTLRTFCYGSLALAPTLLLASVTYYLVEAPCMRIGDRFRSKSAPV